MSDQTVCTRVRQLVESPLAEIDVELVDVEFHAGSLRVTIDHPGDDGVSGSIDLDGIDAASRLVSRILDEADPVPSRYTLEVSSPGIERPLRTPAHFVRCVGATVAVRTNPAGGNLRIDGVLEVADDKGFVVDGKRVGYEHLRSARTVYVWPAQPARSIKPGAKSLTSAPTRPATQVPTR